MLVFEISIKASFCGAHRLAGYQGPCANLHGHNWEVEIFLRGKTTDRLGMLVDFKQVKTTLRAALEKLDHRNLSDLPMFKRRNPTAENIARFIFEALAPAFPAARCRLHRVRVSENHGTAAWYCKKN